MCSNITEHKQRHFPDRPESYRIGETYSEYARANREDWVGLGYSGKRRTRALLQETAAPIGPIPWWKLGNPMPTAEALDHLELDEEDRPIPERNTMSPEEVALEIAMLQQFIRKLPPVPSADEINGVHTGFVPQFKVAAHDRYNEFEEFHSEHHARLIGRPFVGFTDDSGREVVQNIALGRWEKFADAVESGANRIGAEDVLPYTTREAKRRTTVNLAARAVTATVPVTTFGHNDARRSSENEEKYERLATAGARTERERLEPSLELAWMLRGNVSKSTRKVAEYLLDNLDGDKIKQTEIAAGTGLTERTVRRALTEIRQRLAG